MTSFYFALFLVASAAAVEDWSPTRTMWCQLSEQIDIAECRDSAPEEEEGWVRILQKDNCLGRPGKTEIEPRCNTFVLMDRETGMPVEQSCSIMSSTDDDTVCTERVLVAGEVFAPLWSAEVAVSCAGFADISLAPTSPVRQLELQRGRALTLKLAVPGLDGTVEMPISHNIHVSLRRTEGGYTEQRQLALEELLNFGNIPLGEYKLSVAADGYAPVVDGFTLAPNSAPLELYYELPVARCLPLDIVCDGCDGGNIPFTLKRLSAAKPPVQYLEGKLALVRVVGGRFRGEICGVADGAYEIALSPPAHVPLTRSVVVNPDMDPTFIALESGVESRLFLVDTGGVPIANAEVTITWRAGGLPQKASVRGDGFGEVRIPPLSPQGAFSAYIAHKDTVPHRLSGLAGDEIVVQLEPRGAISARIVGDACNLGADVIASIERRMEGGYKSVRENHSPDDCSFEIPVKQPGAYRLTFHGPGFLSHSEELQLKDSLVADLGDIELERGESFRVRTHFHGNPVGGASVRVGRDGIPLRTDDTGIAEFACLRARGDSANTVEFFISHPSYAPRHVTRAVEPDDELVIALELGAEIRGLVLLADGSPAVGETITIAQPNGHAFPATVSGTGKYRVDRLEPGPWIVYRMKTFSDYGTVGLGMGTGDSRSVTLRDGEIGEVDFLPSTEVRGRVFIDGELVDRGFSMGAVQEGTAVSSAIPIQVDGSGSYVARLPRPGVWTFLFGHFAYTTQVESCPCVADIFFSGTDVPSRQNGG